MNRRHLLVASAAAGAAAATVIAAPSVAQSLPQVRWRMPTSFPKSLDTVHGAAETIAKRVEALTEGKFQIRVFAAGEIVPPLQVLDIVQNETVECGYTAGFYYIGKNPALAFDTGIPFGLTPRQHSAWMYEAGGLELMRSVYADFNVISFPAGNTGAQMGGWFRRQIRTVEDFKGLRIRAAGMLGHIYGRLGAVAQQIPGSDVYLALEKGVLDAVEWVGPYDDEKLGFQKVATYYYGPGVLELGASLGFIVGTKAWEKLPSQYQEALRLACREAESGLLAQYDARNVPALRRLIAGGAKLSSWSGDIMKAMQAASRDMLQEFAAKDATFKRVYDQWRPFRDDQHLWLAINDGAAETFLYSNRG